GAGHGEEGAFAFATALVSISMVSRSHERSAQFFFIPALAAMRQSEGVPEFVGNSSNENRHVPAQRHAAIFGVVESWFFAAEIIQVLHAPICRPADYTL